MGASLRLEGRGHARFVQGASDGDPLHLDVSPWPLEPPDRHITYILELSLSQARRHVSAVLSHPSPTFLTS